MALSTQDLVKGIDLTGLNPVTAADLNNLVDLAVPKDDGGGTGKSLNLKTIDDITNTADVPDANAHVEWQRYLWIRHPYLTSDTPVKVYAWNNNIDTGPLLKWQEIAIDLDTLQEEIDDVVLTANLALSNANNASTTANNAAVTANAANIKSTAAQTSASNAKSAATASAASALSAANTVTAIQALLLSYVKLSETKNKGTDNIAAATGKNIRILNTEDINNDGIVTLDNLTGLITFVLAGTYRIKARAPIYWTGTAIAAVGHQLLVVKNSDNSTLITGTSQSIFNKAQTISEVTGELVIAVGTVVRLDHYVSAIGAATVLQGVQANVHPDGGGKEVYAVIEIERISTT